MASAERRPFMATDPSGADIRSDAGPFFRHGRIVRRSETAPPPAPDRKIRRFHSARLCGSSVLTTIGIIVVLLAEAIKFFADVPVVDFLTGTTWTALFQNQQSLACFHSCRPH